MPEKTVREMSSFERKHYSLEGRMFRTIVVSCIVLGFVLLLVGLGLYSFSLVNQYVSHAFYISQSAARLAGNGVDSTGLAKSVMETYRGLSYEERMETGTEAYRARFAEAQNSPAYDGLVRILGSFAQSEELFAIYLAMYDEDSSVMVYLADPSEEERLYPGEWEYVSADGIQKFLNWDGQGMLYDIDRTENYGWLATAGTPIRDENGKVCCFLLVDVSIDNVGRGLRVYALQITVSLIVVIALISFLLLRKMKKTLVAPINEIAEAAQNYVNDRRAGKRDTDHFAMLNIRTGDEVENLSLVMADMERDLSEYEENLTAITAEKERISTELSLATRIQADMLPNIFPAFPERKEFDIFASMDPAKEVGGDFYDFFLVDDDHLCMVIADVSGKGVPAALFMMASKIILDNNAMMGKSPAQILSETNAAICSHNREEMFVTVWLGILEISTGRLTAANAGHEYPALKKPGGFFEIVKDKHGFVIGGMEGVRYKEYELFLEPGAKLFVYTDGVPEATDANNTLFGTDRMLTALNHVPDASPERTLQNVRRDVDGFVKDAEQFDDLTMLCMEYRGPDGGKNRK